MAGFSLVTASIFYFLIIFVSFCYTGSNGGSAVTYLTNILL